MPATTTPVPERTPFDDGALYDALLGDFDYGLDFYLGLARRADGPVLDLACGTGRVLLPCLREGIDVDGLDLYPAMLQRLREKASALALQPCLHQADMNGFQINRRYALIMIPFNAFVHNLTTKDQVSCLTCCREHLRPGGLLAFDTFFPSAAIVMAPENQRVLELETTHPQTGLPMRMFDTRGFDRVQQLQRSMIEIESLDASGMVVNIQQSHTTIRWIYKSEMGLLLRVAGFDHWRISGDFQGRPLENENDAMIVKAWASA